MPKKTTSPYTVVRDSREKDGHGWQFEASNACLGTVVTPLKTGDYSLAGYEHVFAVERKGTVAEFVQNITNTAKWALFKAELERLEAMPMGFVVLEFGMEAVTQYPRGAGLPWAVIRRLRVGPGFCLKRFLEIEASFRTKLLLAGGCGKEVFSSLCKRVVERWPEPPPP